MPQLKPPLHGIVTGVVNVSVKLAAATPEPEPHSVMSLVRRIRPGTEASGPPVNRWRRNTTLKVSCVAWFWSWVIIVNAVAVQAPVLSSPTPENSDAGTSCRNSMPDVVTGAGRVIPVDAALLRAG